MRTVTMFTADSMKVVGRVIDSIGEYSALKAKLRATTSDTIKQESIKTQIKAARKQVVKSVTSLALSGLFMAGVAQLFKWLYDKDRDEDETVLQEMIVDFTGNLFGGLPLSRTETNKVLREIHTNETNYTDGVRQHNEAQNRIKEQAAALDTYARDNIADYKNASASGQAAIRAVLRQGKALGLQEDFVLSCARVSARSGLHIAFSKEASFVAANGSYADGAIDLANNRIIINPEAKSRSGEMILIHELTHAIYNLSDGTLQVAEGLKSMTDTEKEKIRKRYAAVGQGSAVQVSDEINAHFAEQTLSNKNILERLVEKKPTVKDKILGFFKKAKTEYAGDEKLAAAAARLYRQYKKLFDDFAVRNQRHLGVESEAVQATTTYALQEALQTLGDYDTTRKRHIESNENDRISRTYNGIVKFIKSATNEMPVKRLHIGTISERTSSLVQEKTGVNIKDYDFVLASNFIAHIFASHGNVHVETLRGQKSVNYSNIENILETVISPDDVSLANDQSGTALRFEKELDGKNIAITITSTKKSTLTLKSAWIINKKSGGRTPSANASAFAGTSETNGRNSTFEQSISQSPNAETLNRTSETLPRIKTVSNNSIAENSENVNPLDRKAGKTDGNKLYALTVDGETVTGTIEETNDLIALHNLSEEKLLKVLELGGFPMPSIAVAKPNLAHDNFGNITVVFGRETIDPRFDPRNKVFSRDAWTPTTPRIEYKLNEKRAMEIRRKVESLVKGTDAELYGYLSLDFDNMENYLNRNDGDLAETYGRDDAFRYAYLRDKGVEIKLPMIEQEVSSGYGNATIAYVAEKIGKERLAELRKNHRPTDEIMKLVPDIEKYVAESWKKTYDIEFDGELGFSGVSGILDDAYEYADKGFRKTIDKAAASKLFDENIDKKEYKEWLNDLFAGVVDKTGLRNNKDPYTPSGSSRSFEALHDDYTLENVIRAMQKSEQKGDSGWVGISPQALAGKLSKEFKSVAEMKQNAAALTGLTEEANSNFNEVAGNMLSEIAEEMVPRSRYRDNVDYWSGLDGAQAVVGEIADKRLFTEKAIASYMEREYKGIYDYSESVGDKILGLFAYVKQMTQTDYFEAKPRRAVKFGEIKSVLLPDDASSRLKQRLDKVGVPYTVYGNTREQKAATIQRLDEVRFALDENMDNRNYTLMPYTEKQKENWINSKNIVLYESKSQLLEFVNRSRNDAEFRKKMYFGAIGNDLAARIKKSTGLNLENYNYTLQADEVRKIIKDHGNDRTEKLRGQRAITNADFVAIPDIIKSASDIVISEKKYNSQPIIKFIKQNKNERVTVVAVISGKHLDLRVQTEYISVKKGILATLSDEQAPNNTLEASRGTDSINSIGENSENVNPRETKVSKIDSKKRYALAESDFETALDKLDSFKSVEDIKSYFYHVQSMINDEAIRNYYPKTMADVSNNERQRVERIIKATNIEKEVIKAYRKKHKAKPVVDLSTHNMEFFSILSRNCIINKHYLLKPGIIEAIDYRLLMPYESHLNDILNIVNGCQNPTHTTANSLRHILETVCKFEYPEKKIEKYIAENPILSKNADIFTLCQDMSHGAVRNQPPFSVDILKSACKTIV